ncbi:MAG: DEAD/DEAH box helicase family protein, partial [Propionibacteriaceae bacterium]|nr:DEAD/DEAH box helicase family protein [Propionibacteriaceae bacterium]
MNSPDITTFRKITPMIYSWRTPDVPKYAGWEKIGYTSRQSVDDRIAQQASQMSVRKDKVWALRANFQTEAGGQFTDREFHAYLHQRGIERESNPRTEWHRFAGAAKTSLEYFHEFTSQDYTDLQADGEEDYTLRPEQQAAVEQALAAYAAGSTEVLWNAKPRFGKTLTTYDLTRRLDVSKVLIVTNRPAIANSWFDDFTRFIGHQTSFKFVSDSSSLSERPVMSRSQWPSYATEYADSDPRLVEFLSLQDLKGSKYFGGVFTKLKHIADYEWDLLVIDEAHEGVDTTKTDIAFDQIKRRYTLHLSGTPFKALAAGKFSDDEIFNWTYEDEQTARENWTDGSQDNPYAVLPTLNLLTYQISRMITDRLAEGVAIDEDGANVDYTFDLHEFFSTKDNGYFHYEADINRFLDCLAGNEKYPFSTPELRDEIRHSFWLLDRVAS